MAWMPVGLISPGASNPAPRFTARILTPTAYGEHWRRQAASARRSGGAHRTAPARSPTRPDTVCFTENELGPPLRASGAITESIHCGSVESAVRWILGRGYRNVLLEIDNECNVQAYDHGILKPARVHELIDMAKNIRLAGRRLLVGTSYGGGTVPTANVVGSSDFLLMHSNGMA